MDPLEEARRALSELFDDVRGGRASPEGRALVAFCRLAHDAVEFGNDPSDAVLQALALLSEEFGERTQPDVAASREGLARASELRPEVRYRDWEGPARSTHFARQDDVGKSPGGGTEPTHAEPGATNELDDEQETIRPPRDPSGRVQSDARSNPTTSPDRSGQGSNMGAGAMGVDEALLDSVLVGSAEDNEVKLAARSFLLTGDGGAFAPPKYEPMKDDNGFFVIPDLTHTGRVARLVNAYWDAWDARQEPQP